MRHVWWSIPCTIAFMWGLSYSDSVQSAWVPDCRSLAQSSLEECHAQRTVPNVSKKASPFNMKSCLAIAHSTFDLCVEMTSAPQGADAQ